MSKDLRTYLKEIVDTYPDDLKVIRDEVNPKFGITAYASRLAKANQYPGLLFQNVKGAELSCISNLVTTYERVGLFLDCNVEDIPKVYGERLRKPIAPRIVERKDAPVKEVVISGSDVDLSYLPIPTHNELDGGRYLTAGVMVISDPETQTTNAGIYRHHIFDRNTMGVWFLGAHHGGLIYKKYQELGKPAPIAIVIGHHPAFMMGAVSRLQGIGGEYEAVGGLLGEPLELVKAETSELLVPACAEIVIEGEILPDERHPEGPFGEWPGHYLGGGSVPVIRVTSITHRSNAIFQDIVASGREHLMVGAVPRCGSIYHTVKAVVPSLKSVNVPVYARMHCYVSLSKERDSDVKKAAFAALNTEPENLRSIVVVDDDIDVFNEEQVAWALGSRFDATNDLVVIPKWNGPGGLLPTNWDYHADGSRTPKMSSATIMDATKPAPPVQFPERTMVPQSYTDAVNLDSMQPFTNEDKERWFD